MRRHSPNDSRYIVEAELGRPAERTRTLQRYAFALHTMYHNFVKISGAHRMTPAQAAGVDSRLWEIGDIVKVVEEYESQAA